MISFCMSAFLSEAPDSSAHSPMLQTLGHPFPSRYSYFFCTLLSELYPTVDLQNHSYLKIVFALVTLCCSESNSSDAELKNVKASIVLHGHNGKKQWSQWHLAKSKWPTKQHLEHGSRPSEHEKGQNFFSRNIYHVRENIS